MRPTSAGDPAAVGLPLSLRSTRIVVPAVAERLWGAGAYLQFTTFVCFTGIVLGAIVFTLRPNLAAAFKSKLQQSSAYDAARVFCVCAVFMVVGPALMILNKEVLNTLHFDFPLTLSGMGLLFTAIIIRSLVVCGVCEVRPETHEAMRGPLWYQTVLPIAIAKATTLACGNAVYLHLGLGFIQMLKAFNPVIVVAVMRACGLPLPCRLARWGVYLIISGSIVEVKVELNATMLGLVLMGTSEFCEAVNLVLTQKLLQNCKFTLIEGLYMITLPSGVFLCGAAVLLEWPRLLREGMYTVIAENPVYFGGSCLLGFAVNFVSMAVVHATSGLTVKVLNVIRGIGVVVVGVLFYGEYCSTIELWGYSVVLGGFCLYNWAQYVEAAEASEKAQPVNVKDSIFH